MNKRQYYIVSLTLFVVGILMFITIDWKEVEEWEDRYGDKDITLTGMCIPSRPFMFRSSLYPLAIVGSFIIALFTYINIFGDENGDN